MIQMVSIQSIVMSLILNRLAVNDEDKPHLANTLRIATRITGIATADFNAFANADGSPVIASDGDTFDQPAIPYNAEYPYNNVYESESGHIREIDDTSGAERIHERHRTGTSYEIDANGNKVEIIKGESYRLLSQQRTSTDHRQLRHYNRWKT